MKTENIPFNLKVSTFIFTMSISCIHSMSQSKNAKQNTTDTVNINYSKPDTNIVQLTVKYDAVKGELIIPKPAKVHRFFPAKKSIYTNFEIDNINPFFNGIAVKAEQKSFVIDVPAKFLSMLETKKEETKPASEVTSLNTDKINSTNFYVESESTPDTSFNGKLSNYLHNWVTFQKLVALSDFLEPQIKKELTVNAKSFKNGIKKSTITYLNLTDSNNIEKELADKSSQSYQYLISNYATLQISCKKQQDSIVTNSTLKSATNKKDGSLTISIVKDSVPDNPYKEVFTYITTVYNRLLNETTMKTYQDKIDKGILLYQTIQNESYSIISEPKLIEDGSDYLDLTLNINNTDGKTLKTISPIRIYQSGGLKIDFSTGIAFGLGGAKDHSYSLQRQDTSSLTIRKNPNYNKFFPSVAAFIHVYGRDYYRSLLPALTFGISTNPAGLEQTSFYAGGSLMFRNSMLKRIVLSGGLAAANVNYLKNTYQTDYTYTATNFKNYTNLKALKDEDLIERKFRLGWFVSVSYNLSSK